MFRFFRLRVSSAWRLLALLALGLTVVATRVEAQTINFTISAPTNIGVSNTFTCFVYLTNMTGISQTVTVTNTWTGLPAQFSLPMASQGTNVISGGNVIFAIGAMTNTGTASMSFSVMPTAAGFLTNTVALATNGMLFGIGTNSAIVQVTNVLPVADLAVAMTGPSGLIFSNDWMVYNVSVTNLGPSTASGIFLTNTLPVGVGFKGVVSANRSFTTSIQHSNVIFNLGTLTNQAFANFQLTVQPTNAGTLNFVSTVNTNTVIDPVSGNDSAGISVTVSNFLSDPGQLTATMVSTQRFNPLSARLEQNLVLSNAGPNSVDSARAHCDRFDQSVVQCGGDQQRQPLL